MPEPLRRENYTRSKKKRSVISADLLLEDYGRTSVIREVGDRGETRMHVDSLRLHPVVFIPMPTDVVLFFDHLPPNRNRQCNKQIAERKK